MKTRFRVLLATVAAAVAALTVTAVAVQAAPPAPLYEDFAGCPSPTETMSVAFCFKYSFNGGHLQLGKRDVPISNPIIMRGGYQKTTGAYIANSEGGLLPVRQTVTGGLIGLTGLEWLDKVLSEQEQLRVYAVVELAGTPSPVERRPFDLPIKVHLENPVLGDSCYIGSDENPIELTLTNSVPGSEYEAEAERPSVLVSSGALADSTYAVPGASGCQLNLGSLHIPINEVVNRAAGLPAAGGTNEAELSYDFSLVTPKIAYRR